MPSPSSDRPRGLRRTVPPTGKVRPSAAETLSRNLQGSPSLWTGDKSFRDSASFLHLQGAAVRRVLLTLPMPSFQPRPSDLSCAFRVCVSGLVRRRGACPDSPESLPPQVLTRSHPERSLCHGRAHPRVQGVRVGILGSPSHPERSHVC